MKSKLRAEAPVFACKFVATGSESLNVKTGCRRFCDAIDIAKTDAAVVLVEADAPADKAGCVETFFIEPSGVDAGVEGVGVVRALPLVDGGASVGPADEAAGGERVKQTIVKAKGDAAGVELVTGLRVGWAKIAKGAEA